MKNYDVFNGDADGIISLLMLRLHEPRDAELITGRKRDIKLLDMITPAAGDNLTVLDISMKSNAAGLHKALQAGANVFYVDHHIAGEIPDHENLEAVINTAPEVCTATLVDNILEGQFRAWTVTAAYGDNFPKMAERLAHGYELPLEKLKELGVLINYNGYGGSIDDLIYHPKALYQHVLSFETPMAFLEARQDVFETLKETFETDIATVANSKTLSKSETTLVLALEDDIRSRRASGTYGNQLAQENPNRAHAILTRQAGGYLVSIRAPLSNRKGADTIALQFDTGGGRAAAAGINHLPENELNCFIDAFKTIYA